MGDTVDILSRFTTQSSNCLFISWYVQCASFCYVHFMFVLVHDRAGLACTRVFLYVCVPICVFLGGFLCLMLNQLPVLAPKETTSFFYLM